MVGKGRWKVGRITKGSSDASHGHVKNCCPSNLFFTRGGAKLES